MKSIPAVKDIVLLGGGHSHALVIRMWAMNPTPGLRITLISPSCYTPYSGMLPGLIAGHYTFEETHIDLSQLCVWAGVRFIQAEATGIDTDQKTIQLKDRPNLEYDICSVDIGSTPSHSIKGSLEYAVGVKPIDKFNQHWLNLKQELKKSKKDVTKVVVVGGGYGGVEVVLAMQYWTKKNDVNAEFHLCHRGKVCFEKSSLSQQKKLSQRLNEAGIHCHYEFDCDEISETYVHALDEKVSYDKVFYCTQAVAAEWLRDSKLELSEAGFIKVNDHLQSTNDEAIFAAGDISHQVSDPKPKAGVYAVRMAPVLFKNLMAHALRKPLINFKPQSKFLSLSALGSKYAMGAKKPFYFSGKWVWKLKDHIDRKFMNLFHHLSEMSGEEASKAELDESLLKLLGVNSIHDLAMRCGGCGGKVGASVLSKVLSELEICENKDVVVGLNKPDDAAVLKLPANELVVQTVDFLKSFIDDPYIFGQISAEHALSDIFAMNASPHSAQAMVQLPLATSELQKRDMSQLMQGALKVLNEHGCALIGGHTTEDQNLNLGFSVNALKSNKAELHLKQGLKEGQVYILTKPLGTGALFAAYMRAKAKGPDINMALKNMKQSNRKASELFSKYDASVCTDITGFGLLGHLLETLKGSRYGVELKLNDLPVLPGVVDAMKAGIFSSLQPQNSKVRQMIVNQSDYLNDAKYPLLFDPQTSGGLLAAVDEDRLVDCLDELKQSGYLDACCIGKVVESSTHQMVKLV